MRYTEEVKARYHNSEDQHVGLSDRANLEREYDMIRPYGKGKPSSAAQAITLVVALFLIALMVFMIVYQFSGRNETVAKFGTVLLYIVPYGIAFLISFMLLTKKIASQTVYDPARNVFSMVLFGLSAVAAIPALNLIKNAEAMLILAVPGVYLIGAFLFRITERVRMYRMAAEARCIGYSRRIARNYRTGSTCIISPVYEYEADGERFTSVYDRYDHKWSSEVEIDSTKTIYCRKNDPASIISPNKGFPVIILLLAGIALLAIFGVGYYFRLM
ncbi:MAG: hypothetical protein J6W36_04980 [Clostridiales bacterium]|nr:hypothetical protein [Clostridiales bacterium]